MAGLGGNAALTFPLGGEEVAFSARPWIVNLNPPPDTINGGLLTPVQFSIRDVETYIESGTVHAGVGYASVFSHGEDYFERLPRTYRGSLFDGPFIGEPLVELTERGVRITKTSDYLQKTVYFTAVDCSGIKASTTYPSAMVVADLYPEIENIAPADIGPLNFPIFPAIMPPAWMNVRLHSVAGVLGLEHGPRNTGIYVFMINTGTIASPIYQLRVTGPEVDGYCYPDSLIPYNWYGKHKFFLFWNEVTNEAEVYIDINGVSTRIFHEPFLGLNGAMRFTTYVAGGGNYQRHGGDLDIVAAYGQEGRSGSKMTVASIAVTPNVGVPVSGIALLDDWSTTRRSSEVVSMVGTVDPRQASISSWFDTPDYLIANPDPEEVKKVVNKAFRITKLTAGKTASIFREEPGFLRTGLQVGDPAVDQFDGMMLEAKMFASCSQLIQAATGMGFLIFDGRTVYDLALFDDSRTRTIGLLQSGGDPININHRYIPQPPVDWSSPVSFRFTVDPNRGKFELFNQESYLLPAMTYQFSRSMLPVGMDYGVLGRLPFIAFGHTLSAGTLGSFDLYWLNYCQSYQAWESRTEPDPEDATPPFTLDQALNTSPPSTAPYEENNALIIECGANQTARYWRPANFDVYRGIEVEAHCRILSYKPRCRTGAYIVAVDGVDCYMLSFVDTDAGKFACLAQSHNLNSFWEYPGFEGDSARLSFLCDWTQEHRYRLVRHPGEGFYVYLDYEEEPRIAIKDTEYFGLPRPLPDLPEHTPVVGFGQFSGEGCTSEWWYLRTLCGTGYEYATRKKISDDALVEEIFGTEALVAVHATDKDEL